MADRVRDKRGRYQRLRRKRSTARPNNIFIDHNYVCGHVCRQKECVDKRCPLSNSIQLGKHVSRTGWQDGRRIVEFGVLLSNLKTCKFCGLGPVPLTYDNVVGELQRGLGGYLYVKCVNIDCSEINIVAYGKTSRAHGTKGIPSFDVNTKLGTAMIDSIGGPDKVNNFLSTLNLKPIDHKNLKIMERRAGKHIEAVAETSMRKAAEESFALEMLDVAEEESNQAHALMGDFIDDGFSVLPDASPLRLSYPVTESESEEEVITLPADAPHTPVHQIVESPSMDTPTNEPELVLSVNKTPSAPCKVSRQSTVHPFTGVKLLPRYPCKTRTGMSCAVDTAWNKRGFDSLTSHTFFMTKKKYGKKIVKTIVSHRTCGTCKWWRKNRPFQKIRNHRCVFTHSGSARSMESASGVKGVREMKEDGFPIEFIEGDGDNTLIARLQSDLNMKVKKRFDKNHVVKNIGKTLYALQSKNRKLSKSVINHIQKCVKYIFAKNQGDSKGLHENLKALIPHQFGDHTKCLPRFCGYMQQPNETYTHKSLPRKAPLKDQALRSQLEELFSPVIAKAESYADLGSSQQCEHANREVTLRVPKSIHYGNSEALDFRVYATSAFINDGRCYIAKANIEGGLSPGKHTLDYAAKKQKRRIENQRKAELPSTKRRRMILKQERAISQSANETLEGQTYQSDIGHEQEPDIEQLPIAVPRGDFKPVILSTDQKPTYIMFDLETTDLIRGQQIPHITQLAAVEPNSGRNINMYVTPKLPCSSSAEHVTGIVVSTSGMSVFGQPVCPTSVYEALQSFIMWLSTFRNAIVVAHNGKRFDFPVLICALEKNKLLEKFSDSVCAFLDSLPVFRKIYPQYQSHKQEDLVTKILGTSYAAHNALEDVKSLGNLFQHMNLPEIELFPMTFSPMAVHLQRLYNLEKAKNIDSLSPLVSGGIMKNPTAENIAGSGLSLKHLKKIFERDGEDGLLNIFTCKNTQGQPRVTNSKRILENVIPKLAEYFKNK